MPELRDSVNSLEPTLFLSMQVTDIAVAWAVRCSPQKLNGHTIDWCFSWRSRWLLWLAKRAPGCGRLAPLCLSRRDHDHGCPNFRGFVQSHDILYKVSRDILYTPRARSARGWRKEWLGRRWMCRSNACGLWWRRRRSCGRLGLCVRRM